MLPAELVAASEKVMLPVPVVFTDKLPDTGTGPKPAMLAEVALTVFQVNVVEPPAVTVAGSAVNESMVGSDKDPGGGVEALTTTTTVEADIELEPLVASSIYVVVAGGLTEVEPLVPTFPMPLILAPVALDVVQFNSEKPPGLILVGEAVNDDITGSPEAGVCGMPPVPATARSTVDLVEPALLLAVRI